MKSTKFWYWIIGIGIFVFVKCNQDEFGSRPFTRLITHEVSSISDTGAIFMAEMIERDNQPILEAGFIYTADTFIDVNQNNRLMVSADKINNIFFLKIDRALIANHNYLVRSYIVTANYTVYGNTVMFNSKGSKWPLIKSFSPLEALCGDTIKIIGSNFSSFAKENLVRLDNVELAVISASDSVLHVLAEYTQSQAMLSVSVLGKRIISETPVKMILPEVTDLYPLQVGIGDTVTLIGRKLSKMKNFEFKIYELILKPIRVYEDSIKFKIENFNFLQFYEKPVLISNCGEFRLNQDIIYKPPVIDSIYPRVITDPDQRITIIGRYFFPGLNGFEIITPGLVTHARGLSFSPTKLDFVLNEDIVNGISKHFDFNVSFQTYSGKIVSPSLRLEYDSYWTKLKDFPGGTIYGGEFFSLNGYAYFGLGFGPDDEFVKDIWRFDPVIDQWQKETLFPGEERENATFFIINNKVFIGLGDKSQLVRINGQQVIRRTYFYDFYSYDPSISEWSRISDFPGESRSNAEGFTLNNEGYILGGYQIDSVDFSYKYHKTVYKYNQVANAWSVTSPLPVELLNPAAFQFGQSAYIFDTYGFYEFTNGNWIKLNSVGDLGTQKASFMIGDKVYFEWPGQTPMFLFNLVSKNAVNLNLRRSYINFMNSTSIGNKGYMLASPDNNQIISVWKFDPSRTK